MERHQTLVELSVCGTPFTVRQSVLAQVPGSMLAAMFSGDWTFGHHRDSHGRVYLECDSDCFRILVAWLVQRQQLKESLASSQGKCWVRDSTLCEPCSQALHNNSARDAMTTMHQAEPLDQWMRSMETVSSTSSTPTSDLDSGESFTSSLSNNHNNTSQTHIVWGYPCATPYPPPPTTTSAHPHPTPTLTTCSTPPAPTVPPHLQATFDHMLDYLGLTEAVYCHALPRHVLAQQQLHTLLDRHAPPLNFAYSSNPAMLRAEGSHLRLIRRGYQRTSALLVRPAALAPAISIHPNNSTTTTSPTGPAMHGPPKTVWKLQVHHSSLSKPDTCLGVTTALDYQHVPGPDGRTVSNSGTGSSFYKSHFYGWHITGRVKSHVTASTSHAEQSQPQPQHALHASGAAAAQAVPSASAQRIIGSCTLMFQKDDVLLFALDWQRGLLQMWNERLGSVFLLQLPVAQHYYAHVCMFDGGESIEVLEPGLVDFQKVGCI